MIKKGLGKGLGALITSAGTESNEAGITELRINDIEPNVNQPRKNFDDQSLIQLSESIKSHGIMQPIIVKKEEDIYRIVAGERRWRAARLAGLVNIPVIIKELSNKQVMEMALIENLQREDLNAIEEADAFDRLMKEYNLTQEDVSAAVGENRSAIANSIRLLALGEKIKGYIISGELTSGHARALIAIEDKELQQKLAEGIITREINVRDTEKLVKKYLQKKVKKDDRKSIELIEIEDRLKNIFGTKVQLLSNNKKKGKILIEYYSNEELDRILEMCTKIGEK